MDIKNVITEILHHYFYNQDYDCSSEIYHIVKERDVLLAFYNKQKADEMLGRSVSRTKAITLQDIERHTLRGHHKPLLLDSSAIEEILRAALRRIQELEALPPVGPTDGYDKNYRITGSGSSTKST